MSRRREEYVGEWLPEPLLTSADSADGAELAENVSIAMLTVLETLGRRAGRVRAARGVRDPNEEIAEVMGGTTAAVHQIAHRARQTVAARRPRVQVERAQQQAAVRKLMAAFSTGNVQRLVEVLASDVVLIADRGSVVAAARAPIVGADKVLAFLAHAVKSRRPARRDPAKGARRATSTRLHVEAVEVHRKTARNIYCSSSQTVEFVTCGIANA